MSTLSDWQIRHELQTGNLRIDGLPRGALTGGTELQPASVDLRLDYRFRVLSPEDADPDTTDTPWPCLDPAEDSSKWFVEHEVDPQVGRLILRPGECCLAQTYERVTLGPDLLGRWEGKSSLGRLFLLTHATAGYIDPGFAGNITLELVNLAPLPIVLRPGMRIGQLALERVRRPLRPYGARSTASRYQGQSWPTPSRSWQGFTYGLPDHPTESRHPA